MIKEFSDLPTLPGWGVYDWQQILGRSYTQNATETKCTITLGMLYKVHAMHVGPENDDGLDYAALVELEDGDWATVHAGADNTGWGCHGDYVQWRRFATRDDAIMMGLTNESRRWLDLELRDDQD
jgi:hypothetical protein